MRIPNGEHAHVPEETRTGYLLARVHPVGGRPRARFFRALGYDESTVPHLAEALLGLARADHAQAVDTPFGTKYVAEGDLHAPSGRVARICTVWIVDASPPRPRFVTAYPV